jgi:hypothetical protein
MQENNTVTVEKAREVLGTMAKNMTDIEISEMILLFETMADQTIEAYETSIFGKPLKQLLTKDKHYV